MEIELWSIKERRVYPMENTTKVMVGGIALLATPKGEILVTREK